MQIVIDIDDKLYETYKDRPPMLGDAGMDMIAQSIANGTPLPKGHGRLIDADAMQKYQIDTFGQRLLVIDTAPTIIEADKESEVEE